jgi:hypothetical protein
MVDLGIFGCSSGGFLMNIPNSLMSVGTRYFGEKCNN